MKTLDELRAIGRDLPEAHRQLGAHLMEDAMPWITVQAWNLLVESMKGYGGTEQDLAPERDLIEMGVTYGMLATFTWLFDHQDVIAEARAKFGAAT